ncbi:MAG: hypothetical protein M1828_004052 [Chrysothrix sp. TS-e1954]|nr:MAG: hypothetical protein M1828_004052 [Chrysothrix sp. TS-e1954]
MANKGYSQYGGNPYAASGSYNDGYGEDMSQQPTGASSNYGTGASPYQTESTYTPQPSAGYGTSQGYGQSQPAQSSGAGGYGQSNPYGSSAPAPSQDYGSNTGRTQATPSQMEQGQSTTTGGTAYGAPPANAPLLSNQDFLSRVEGVRTSIRTLTSHVAEIGSLHQASLSNTSAAPSSQLEHLVSQTSVLNTQIKDQIKFLERDALKDAQQNGGKKNTTKESQVKTLKSNFEGQLKDYNQEESVYRQRYRDQIARQYRIVNPEATDSEVHEATQADWNNEGVFQTALKSNRTGAASSVLGAVRARHNDIQTIERTITELNQLFLDLAEQVVLQEEPIRQTEQKTTAVVDDQKNANQQLDKGIRHARNVKKMKWWCLGIAVLIVVILALVLGLYFGLKKNNDNNGNGNGS